MKKSGIILLAVLIIFTGVFAAGCTEKIDITSPDLIINVAKNGNANYTVGDTFTISLPNTKIDGYEWVVTIADGLNVKESNEHLSLDTITGSTDTHKTFTFTALETGNNMFVVKYMKPGDESSSLFEYSDFMMVKPGKNNTRGIFEFEGESLYPNTGGYVFIICEGNPKSDDYELYIDNHHITKGLQILSEDAYVFEGTLDSKYGGEGHYLWVVTAREPGTYFFAVMERIGKNSETKFFVPITFVK
ncbi:MAG TPA: protease inhibitor I42 family protein [Methanocorpusculum sp.]|nr:protease inhibitor I42 family protein [Methanocorpusculum sp.]HJJ40034.1 protease inhibitor I42 family protein [Methanocorpusculum sp.]HJJ49517.1 protease inhibitor I42 family protein [Methanocorpusculum sp.]HJJ57069.1 protease inhibitor I42 family protein [Methanocorpusculum sp.]